MLLKAPEVSPAQVRALATAATGLVEVGKRDACDHARTTAVILRQRKFVGYTVTAANANPLIIAALAPKVIVVEEAAEVLGPLITGLLPPSTEHLVLIGDHQQLAPRVNDRIAENRGLSISEMERLVLAEVPYSTLEEQNRMCHGIAPLIHDLYPNLKDGKYVQGVKLPLVLPEGPIFWDHSVPEEGRVRNIGESRRVVFLACLLLGHGFIRSKFVPSKP